MKLPIPCCLLILAVWAPLSRAGDPFSENVRTTPPLTPAEEVKAFHLPPGFQIELVASEPDIGKPMNLAFDSRGRLWVSNTHLYPFPAKTQADRKDTLKVIELGPDGRAVKLSTFADKLDIPVGLYPIGDGSRVLAYDVGNIRLYSDTDGDGKADKRELLYSGFGYDRDTHGMSSNYRRGFDGWLYGCHGFNNISNVKGGDGQVMHLQSGNTYRMRLDGSHIEPFTIGQVNPFGMSMDPLGNIYTSDSHSKPIYQLLRGGRYEAFDRNTDDGLGLAPMMMHHLHGSTAIAGSCFLATDSVPAAFRGNVLEGNVVTCRINRDRLEYHGSTPKAIEMPDFLTCDDPWFRPNQTVLGPDGALYVSDFYNRIIGHYEVSLTDPRRDYQRGRVWRITYHGDGAASPTPFDVSKANVSELIEKLNDPNITARMMVICELSDRAGKDAVAPLKAMLQGGKASSDQKIGALWTLYRLDALEGGLLQTAAGESDRAVRVHAMRILSETPKWDGGDRDLALKGLSDADALVRRCAADALGMHPGAENIKPLLELRRQVDPSDTHLLYVVRRALRNQLAAEGTLAAVEGMKLDDSQVNAIADAALAVDSPEAGNFLLAHLGQLAADKGRLEHYLLHAVRYATSADADPLAKLMRERFADDIDLQLDVFHSVRTGVAQRNAALSPGAVAWGRDLAMGVLGGRHQRSGWVNHPLAGATAPDSPDPWAYQMRNMIGGGQVEVLSSFPGGEQATGVLRSSVFVIPPTLSFYLCGHNENPAAVPQPVEKNFVRLCAADGGSVIAKAPPPRDDAARKITWDLRDHAGQKGYLEVVDGDAGTGYAWIAFGKLDPQVVPLPQVGSQTIQKRIRSAAEVAAELKLTEAAGGLREVIADRANDVETRAAAANALATVGGDDGVAAMRQVTEDPAQSIDLREAVARALGGSPLASARSALVDGFKVAPRALQTTLALSLAASHDGAEALLGAVKAGKAPAGALLEPGMHDRLAAANVADLDARLGTLTQGVAAPKQELEKLIAQRRADFVKSKGSPGDGAAVFAKNCMVCHQIDGKGGVVGPQLTGIAKRGIDRVCEDILDPNRNVDPAFRYSMVTLKDDRFITGLQKRDEGELLVFVDSTGKEISVRKSDIRKRLESKGSLMPGNFGEILKPDEFNNLLAYLISR
jgi:putative heme-binding domain-containing protein